ncbi:ubiquinone biosynthesis accessory factor UbiJ [Uliginosibacterium gangwonense]|uniref:ubiquinone biosynthesis accessory factor UbiJ n=1 Tax=Uliginosibacterium gangwonense TaxID=392736 RepID=UPI0003748ECB|nr:SCP2 sterol-binding domain-containing protein [Uliginosibacterium gangwonense]
MFKRSALAFLNHLLGQQSWARKRLGEHVGEVAILHCGLLALRFQVTAEGLVSEVGHEVEADVELRLPASALGDILGGRLDDLSRHVEVGGNARFAETLSLLLGHLRPDLGAALSPMLGDALAHRTELVVGGALSQTAEIFKRGPAGLAEFLREERQGGPLGQAEFQVFRQELDTLGQRLAQLEARLHKH